MQYVWGALNSADMALITFRASIYTGFSQPKTRQSFLRICPVRKNPVLNLSVNQQR
jgi:hypothetical protein